MIYSFKTFVGSGLLFRQANKYEFDLPSNQLEDLFVFSSSYLSFLRYSERDRLPEQSTVLESHTSLSVQKNSLILDRPVADAFKTKDA